MTFAHDTVCALQSAVALANSALPPDSLTEVADLASFFHEHGYTGRLAETTAELQAVRAIRDDLRRLLVASREDAVGIVNGMLAAARVSPRLVSHPGLEEWHLHAVPDDAPLAERITVETAMAMVDVIRADECSRLSVCADQTCAGVVLDLSRNRSRRYCSTACTNRNAVAAYRARRRGGA